MISRCLLGVVSTGCPCAKAAGLRAAAATSVMLRRNVFMVFSSRGVPGNPTGPCYRSAARTRAAIPVRRLLDKIARPMSLIRDCLPPDRHPRRPGLALPAGSIDTHVHVFEPGYPLSPARGYNPPPSTLADLEQLHATLGVGRVVFTQPSVYGIDNSAILDAMDKLNARKPGRARAVVALDMNVTEKQLAALDARGVRGVRLNTDNQGGMPVGFDDIPELEARIRPFGWHLEFLFPGKDIVELMPVFGALKVPMSIAHFAYQPAAAGVAAPGFRALLELARRGNTWI